MKPTRQARNSLFRPKRADNQPTGAVKIAAATICVRNRAAYLFPADILKTPLRQPLLQRLQLSHNLFFPTGRRRGKTIRFQREQVFYAPKDSAESFHTKFFSKLDDGLQPDMRIAKIRNHFRNLAHTAVFPFISSLPDFVCDQTQCGPQFLEMLAKLVHGLAPLSSRTLCLFEGRLNLLVKNSFQSASKRFTRFESVAHRFEKTPYSVANRRLL